MHWRVKWDVLWVKGDVLYSHARRKETMNDLLYICNCQQVDPFQNCFEGRKKSCKISRSLAYTFWEYSIRLLHPEDGGSKPPQNVAIWYSTRRHVPEDLDIRTHRNCIKLQNSTFCFVHFPVWYSYLNELSWGLSAAVPYG